ncbi:MAG TPA: hypothetical protein VGB64_15000 [Actinomycetota bacterium]
MPDPIQRKIKALVDSLGGSVVAELLGVDRSQPSRWKSGKSQPSAQMRGRILDLEYVLSRLEEIFEPAVAVDWLYGINAFLGHQRPIDVMRIRGVTEVIGAVDAEAGLAFA